MAFLLTVFLFLFGLFANVHSFTGLEVQMVAKMANEYGAPFAKTGFEKLHGEIFGKGRAARSTDVAVINTTDKKFKLIENGCSTGGWSTNLFPEHTIAPHHSYVYGAESYGFMTGATECIVKYRSADGSSFELNTGNPYFGPVTAQWTANGVEITKILGRGNNNIVKFIVE